VSLLIVEIRKNAYIKSQMPMTNSTSSNIQTSKLNDLKNKLAHPSKDTLFFLQLFARMYEPGTMMRIA